MRLNKKRLYRIWVAMRQRCNNPNNDGYKNYGGRGITVMDSWNSYHLFEEWSLSNGYNDSLTIDRIDNNLGYYPANCRWVTSEENGREMCRRHKEAKTGGFSESSFEKIRITNKKNLGCKYEIIEYGVTLKKLDCLISGAEFIKRERGLETSLQSLKKNISACLHGKRGKCHGYEFRFLHGEL